jgi:hypothetical protein
MSALLIPFCTPPSLLSMPKRVELIGNVVLPLFDEVALDEGLTGFSGFWGAGEGGSSFARMSHLSRFATKMGHPLRWVNVSHPSIYLD